MPLIRIDVLQGRSQQQLRAIADTVHQVMLDAFAAPDRDRYQIITEHPVGHIIAEDTGLGLRAHGRRHHHPDLPARAGGPPEAAGLPAAVEPAGS